MISLHGALDQPISWVVDAIVGGGAVSAWRVPISEMPDNALPNSNVLLYPHLEPLIRLTAKGDSIIPGHVPGSLIKQLITSVEKSLKILTDFVVERSAKAGRPTESLRKLYALDTQDVSFASLSIAFRNPHEFTKQSELFQQPTETKVDDNDAADFDRVVAMLSRGVKWLSEQTAMDPKLPECDALEQIAILEAVKLLTPSAHGPATVHQISGRIVVDTPVVTFNCDARTVVNRGLKRTKTEAPTVFDQIGKIRELDRDYMTFHLRRIDDSDEQKCSFAVDVLDNAMDALDAEHRVRVIGERAAATSIPHIIMVTPEPASEQIDTVDAPLDT